MNCIECKEELETYANDNICQPCKEYLDREKQKNEALEKINQIQFHNSISHSDDVILRDKLNELYNLVQDIC